MNKTQPAPARGRSVGVHDSGTPALSDKQRSYKALFDSFTHDSQGKISPFEVLTRLTTAFFELLHNASMFDSKSWAERVSVG
jgi:hypothetical protein